jgi:hypothetical protein
VIDGCGTLKNTGNKTSQSLVLRSSGLQWLAHYHGQNDRLAFAPASLPSNKSVGG